MSGWFSFGLDSGDVRKIVWTFVQAFFAAFWATASGWSVLPNLATAKAAAVSAVIAAVAAVISLIKNGALSNDAPVK